jgi:FlaA1/EpsC-like NDP-sugar epimerase
MEKLKVSRKYILILIDAILINLSYILAYSFRFNFNIPNYELMKFLNKAIIITLIYIAVFYIFRVYKSLWYYAGTDDFLLAVAGCITGSLVSMIYTAIANDRIPYSIAILGGIFTTLLVVGFRVCFRIYGRSIKLLDRSSKNSFKRVMIIGAGVAGSMTIKEMKLHPEMKSKPVALIDIDNSKIGTSISGVKVFGNRNSIKSIVEEEEIDIILLAIPSIDYKNKRDILNICKQTKCKIQIIPGIFELIDGKVSLKKVRDVSYEDLLGRAPVKLDTKGIEKYITNKTVMITGGGGSIGSEICRQIAKFKPKEVVLFDVYENGVYELEQELRYLKVDVNIKCVIASITDKRRLEKTFEKYKPEVIFHAAAHKHVPLMESNPQESVLNNVFGTLNLAKCADKYKVKRFVMISTDKAVNPTNIMGATKRLCEMIIQSIDKKSETEFVAVRFGNVLGSNGSVIPLFKKQIAQGGPVSVTHPEINRFFMTIPEAAQLVLQAGAFAEGGEIFVLDMEDPVKIYDLACDLIRLSGFEPNEDIKIEFVGLRPGEKLYEEVLTEEEGLNKTVHEKIFIGRPTFDDFDRLKIKLDELKIIAEEQSAETLINKMEEMVPTYERPVIDMVAATLTRRNNSKLDLGECNYEEVLGSNG